MPPFKVIRSYWMSKGMGKVVQANAKQRIRDRFFFGAGPLQPCVALQFMPGRVRGTEWMDGVCKKVLLLVIQ